MRRVAIGVVECILELKLAWALVGFALLVWVLVSGWAALLDAAATGVIR